MADPGGYCHYNVNVSATNTGTNWCQYLSRSLPGILFGGLIAIIEPTGEKISFNSQWIFARQIAIEIDYSVED